MKTSKQNHIDRKLIPKLSILSYGLMALGIVIFAYVFYCEKVPSGKNLFGPTWEVLKGGSCSADFDDFTLSDKEAAQLYFISPFFIALGSILKLVGIHRDER